MITYRNPVPLSKARNSNIEFSVGWKKEKKTLLYTLKRIHLRTRFWNLDLFVYNFHFVNSINCPCAKLYTFLFEISTSKSQTNAVDGFDGNPGLHIRDESPMLNIMLVKSSGSVRM